MGYLLAINKSVTAIGADGYGMNHLPINFDDAALITWAKQFPTYSGDFEDFVDSITEYLCAQTPTAVAKAYIKSKVPSNFYEWPQLSDAEKIIPTRIIMYTILTLADYQLA
jgi:hypothetical protein